MCGDIARHTVTEEQSYLAIPGFFDDCFMYIASRIAEFLNDIRWAVFEYLVPEFQRAWYPMDDIRYGYHAPREIDEPSHAPYTGSG